ncbi:MAG: hypothetical protein IPO52_08815 [Gemmatimonadetes bacterium]|nr:hypothetical protein [Gemmatimonadota bacterium]MBK9549180.1 hypothetical protein [Gemmatimonadota bacterium]MBP9899589.1 hypothetical protein [Gemmatimonadales bacterium]
MRFVRSAARAWLATATVLLLSSCGGEPTTPKLPSELYRMRVQSTAGAVGALLVSVEGGSGTPLLLAAAPVTASMSDGTSPSRVLLVGPLGGVDLLEVRATTPGVPPTVTVLEASAGASGGYAAISPGSVTVTWTGVER